MAQRRPVTTRRRGDVDRRPTLSFERGRLPRSEATGVAPRRSAPDDGRDHGARRRQQRPSASSRLSSWWSWREQDGVDRPEVGREDRRAYEFPRRRPPAEGVPPAGSVERRIGEKPPTVELDQRRRAADVRDADVRHALLGTSLAAHALAFSSAHASASSAISSHPSWAGSRCGPAYSFTSVTVFDL